MTTVTIQIPATYRHDEIQRLSSLLVNLMQTVQSVEDQLRELGMDQTLIDAHETYGRIRDAATAEALAQES